MLKRLIQVALPLHEISVESAYDTCAAAADKLHNARTILRDYRQLGGRVVVAVHGREGGG